MRSLRNQPLVLASHNRGKLEEFAELLAPYGVIVKSVADFGLPEPEETETSFRGNAALKAEAACKATGMIAIADDSGLCVEALGGAPGVYTADWAGVPRDWMVAMQRVEDELHKVQAISPAQRRGSFLCTLCVMWPDGEQQFFEGAVHGALVWPPRGVLGHGYDPVFQPEGFAKTFAELTHAEKNSISHRAIALQRLTDALF